MKLPQFINESENRGIEVENFLLFVVEGFSLGEILFHGSDTVKLIAEYTEAFVDEVHDGSAASCWRRRRYWIEGFGEFGSGLWWRRCVRRRWLDFCGLVMVRSLRKDWCCIVSMIFIRVFVRHGKWNPMGFGLLLEFWTRSMFLETSSNEWIGERKLFASISLSIRL